MTRDNVAGTGEDVVPLPQEETLGHETSGSHVPLRRHCLPDRRSSSPPIPMTLILVAPVRWLDWRMPASGWSSSSSVTARRVVKTRHA